ncbi:hypothetical protein [Levilactobacillus cerevisiae]|uniref:hypothetical protein n=1 Tax=Levilactobacillus cerevisiae TaxID=1704076 RepID=UPI000F7AA6AA|nr:hypothetical protein [Levilactobacillus cerevisiae]
MADSPVILTIDVTATELAEIDVLIDQGVVHSREDFLNRAVRQELERNRAIIQTVSAEEPHGKSLDTLVGSYTYTDQDILEQLKQGTRSKLFIIGHLNLSKITNEGNLFKAIKTITVVGKLTASPTVVAHYQGS